MERLETRDREPRRPTEGQGNIQRCEKTIKCAGTFDQKPKNLNFF